MRPLPSGSTLLEESGPVWHLARERARGAPPAEWRLRREGRGAVLEGSPAL
jgi:hypothetical protein